MLVDVDPATLNLDPAAFERAITPRTKAIVPVHVSGRAAAIEPIARPRGRAAASRSSKTRPKRCSQRPGGKCLGTFGRAGCFSFSPNKTITTGQGGIVVTDDDALAVRLRELKDQGRPVRGTGGNDMHAVLGYNFKLTNLQAAVGVAQLRKLEARVAHLRDIYRWYAAGLAGVPQVRLLAFRRGRAASRRSGWTPSPRIATRWSSTSVSTRHALPPVLVSRFTRSGLTVARTRAFPSAPG